MLGIIIGVFALVVLVSIVNGATGTITNSVSSMGTNALMVSINDDKGNPLRLTDLTDMKGQGYIGEVSPVTQTQVTISGRTENKIALAYGILPDYQSIEKLSVDAGRLLMQPDVDNHVNAVVVDRGVVKDLMKISDPERAIGKNITIGGQSYTVVGVLKDRNGSSMMMFTMYTVYFPYTTMIRQTSVSKDISTFLVSASDPLMLDAAEDQLGKILLSRFRNDEEAFSVLNISDVMDVLDTVTGMLSVVLGGVAAISLLVGGIGIMNIMLVSVTERTKEIGIRKAIGAGRRTILLQFLIESLMLSVIGGMIGLVFSWITLEIISGFAASRLGEGVAVFELSPGISLFAVSFSLAVGLIFGIHPANKAAKMKPIDALRYNG